MRYSASAVLSNAGSSWKACRAITRTQRMTVKHRKNNKEETPHDQKSCLFAAADPVINDYMDIACLRYFSHFLETSESQ